MNRICGECNFCCEILEVAEISKKQWIPCEHQCDQGCNIYENRPTPCNKYNCYWLEGNFEENDRPDKVGLIIDNGNQMFKDVWGDKAINVRETRPGIVNSEKATDLINRLKNEKYIIFLKTYAGGVNTSINTKEKQDFIKETMMKIGPVRIKNIKIK